MHTRRDQVEAHNFVANRLRSALLRGEPDLTHTPMRRTPLGLTLGLVISLVVLGVVTLVGALYKGSSPDWRAPGTFVVDKATGNRYVTADDGVHPVLNYASAKLLLGAGMKQAEVSTSDLRGAPLGSVVGIPWAPDALPPAASSTTSDAGHRWRVCSDESVTGNATRPTVTVALDPSAALRPAGNNGALLVSDPQGTVFLVEGGRRMRVLQRWVPRALGLDAAVVRPVRSSWLNVLPQGPDLGSLSISSRGEPGPGLGSVPTRIGQILVAKVPGLDDRHYVVTAAGLAPLGTMATALALGDPTTGRSYPGGAVRELAITARDLSSARLTAAATVAPDLPSMPRVLENDRALPCVDVLSTGRSAPRVSFGSIPAGAAGTLSARPGLTTSATTADEVSIPRGGGMLARSAPDAGVRVGALYLITEDGAAYRVADDGAAKALGYSAASAVSVPPAILALLPEGPVLTTSAKGGSS